MRGIAEIIASNPDEWNRFVNASETDYGGTTKPLVAIHYIVVDRVQQPNKWDPTSGKTIKVWRLYKRDVFEYHVVNSSDFKKYVSEFEKNGMTGHWCYNYFDAEPEKIDYSTIHLTPSTYYSPNVITNYDYKLGQYKVTASALNVRSGAGTEYNPIGSLTRGTYVDVLATKGNWGQINYNNKKGWICLDYTTYEATSYSSSQSISSGGGVSYSNSSWSTSSTGDYMVVVNKLNIREYASTNNIVLFQLNTGDIVHVVETTNKPDGSIWAHITYGDLSAYCCMKTSGGKYYLSQKISPSKPYVNVTGGTSQSDSYFSWNNCSYANKYDVRIYNSSGQLVDSKFGLTSTSYQTRLKAGNYQVDVASVYSNDSYTFSDRVNFTVNKVTPDKPLVKVVPGNDLSDTCISWNNCKYADYYDVNIYKSNGTRYKTITNTTATSFKGNLSDIADYYVIVTAKNKTDGTNSSSDKKSFTVVSAVPSKPTLSLIAGNNHTNTVFTWNVCENANTYTLDVTNTDTGQKVLSKSLLTVTNYEMILSVPGNYSAQVTSVYTKGGTTNKSDIVKFYVEDVDVKPFSMSVSGVSDTIVSLEWKESLHATNYDVYRYSEGKYTLVGSTSELSYVDTGLYVGTEYKYYIHASNEWTDIKSDNEVTAKTILLYLNGSGSEESPYIISSEDDWMTFTDLINNPKTNKLFASSFYKQTVDINFESAIIPIGTKESPFKGAFDGNYCTITGLTINQSNDNIGLFGYCEKATLKNIVVHGTITSSFKQVGGIVGQMRLGGSIENCAFYGNVSGSNNVGGIVGSIDNGADIIRCYHMGNIKGTNSGGISGKIAVGNSSVSVDSNISYCYHAGGTITGTNNGGITGKEEIGTTKKCTIKYSDCYYLKDSASSATNGTTNAGVLSAPDTVLQNLIETLGEPFVDGGESNNHYPIFIWESKLHEFKGQGTVSSPFLIETPSDLVKMSEYVNNKYLNTKYGNACYLQTADIDLNNMDFEPIGTESTPFRNRYNGGYHTISGLNVTGKNAGLFGYVNSAKIENLIVNGKVSASINGGGLIGCSSDYTELYQCAFNGSVQADNSGGLIGKAIESAKITVCYQNGSVNGKQAGGLIGFYENSGNTPKNSLEIISSYHGSGNITGDGAVGLVSENKDAIFCENVFYLNSTAESSICSRPVNETVLKDLAVTLEHPYSHGNINNGYPAFEWQISHYEFDGNGSIESPYIISTPEDLIALQRYINDPTYNSIYGNAYYKQENDIDLGDREWEAIGINSDYPFNGVYDGNYCTIFGLNAYGDTYSGLFGQVGATSNGRNAGIYNLIIKYGSSCSSTGITGGTAAVLMSGATINQCSVIGDLSGGNGVGGLVGIVRKSASIYNSFHNGNIWGNSNVGGLVGYIESGTLNIENCYHTSGSVYANEHFGAIIGNTKGALNINNCFYLDGSCDYSVNNGNNAGINSVNSMVLQNLSITLGDSFIDNFTLYNDGYPIFRKQFELDEPEQIAEPGQIQDITNNITLFGDVNCNGAIEMSDAVLIMQQLSNPNKYGIGGTDPTAITDQGLKNADVYNNGDGVTVSDALSIQKYCLKLIDSLPEY